jgi:hypothetical protein
MFDKEEILFDSPINCWSFKEIFNSGKTLRIAILTFDGSSDELTLQETWILQGLFSVII